MGTTQPVVKFTYEDYRTAPPDRRYELLDGDLVMVPAPNLKHQTVQLELATQLTRFIKDRALGKLFIAPCDVVLSDTDVVQPDLLFVSREREHLLSGGENVRGAPDLVIEILSPATADRDRGYKHALYGRHGVMEYWLVDRPPRPSRSIANVPACWRSPTPSAGDRRYARRCSLAWNSTWTTSSRLEGERRTGPWRERTPRQLRSFSRRASIARPLSAPAPPRGRTSDGQKGGPRLPERPASAARDNASIHLTAGHGRAVEVTPEIVVEMLGAPKRDRDFAGRHRRPGTVLGLCFTARGGQDVSFVQASRLPDTGALT